MRTGSFKMCPDKHVSSPCITTKRCVTGCQCLLFEIFTSSLKVTKFHQRQEDCQTAGRRTERNKQTQTKQTQTKQTQTQTQTQSPRFTLLTDLPDQKEATFWFGCSTVRVRRFFPSWCVSFSSFSFLFSKTRPLLLLSLLVLYTGVRN